MSGFSLSGIYADGCILHLRLQRADMKKSGRGSRKSLLIQLSRNYLRNLDSILWTYSSHGQRVPALAELSRGTASVDLSKLASWIE
jgi:hypothetical protein